MKRWRKLGRLYECKKLHDKLMTHAANPLPIHLDGDVYRVFFSARDGQNRSSIGAVDIDMVSLAVVREFDEPFFQHGDSSSFYSHGVSIGNIYQANGVTYMLFMGWQQPDNGHWFGEIGRLILHDDWSLSLESDQPFMGVDEIDPISLSYPWVEKIGDKYCMWYGSTKTWDAGNNEMIHNIKYAESLDGHDWEKKGNAVPYAVGQAQAFSKPTVMSDKCGGLTMWFSFRSGDGTPYRIGQSCSKGGVSWNDVVISPGLEPSSDNGWDTNMAEYPFVFSHSGDTYMLFNGDQYGKTGFGLAILLPEL